MTTEGYWVLHFFISFGCAIGFAHQRIESQQTVWYFCLYLIVAMIFWPVGVGIMIGEWFGREASNASTLEGNGKTQNR